MEKMSRKVAREWTSSFRCAPSSSPAQHCRPGLTKAYVVILLEGAGELEAVDKSKRGTSGCANVRDTVAYATALAQTAGMNALLSFRTGPGGRGSWLRALSFFVDSFSWTSTTNSASSDLESYGAVTASLISSFLCTSLLPILVA